METGPRPLPPFVRILSQAGHRGGGGGWSLRWPAALKQLREASGLCRQASSWRFPTGCEVLPWASGWNDCGDRGHVGGPGNSPCASLSGAWLRPRLPAGQTLRLVLTACPRTQPWPGQSDGAGSLLGSRGSKAGAWNLASAERAEVTGGAGREQLTGSGLQGGLSSPSYRRSVLSVHWKD